MSIDRGKTRGPPYSGRQGREKAARYPSGRSGSGRPNLVNVFRTVVPAGCLVLAVVAAAISTPTVAMVFLGVAMVTGIVDLWIHIAVASQRDRAARRGC